MVDCLEKRFFVWIMVWWNRMMGVLGRIDIMVEELMCMISMWV